MLNIGSVEIDNNSEELFPWSDKLCVGIEEIDAQHRVLVDLVNELHRAIHERQGSEVGREILGRLVEYTRIHFTVEESLMRVLGYPDYEEHKKHHTQLIEQVNNLHKKVIQGQQVSFELLHFLRVWLSKHIMEEDREYVPFMLSKGVAANYKKRSWLDRIFHHE